MSCCVEPLEGRTLFTAVVGPTNVQSAYDALVLDATRLKADVAAEAKVVAKDDKVIAADVKALGKIPANTALLKQVQSAAAKTLASLSNATTRYVTASQLPFKNLALAAGYVEESLTPGNAKRLATDQAKVQAVASDQFTALVSAATNAGATLDNAYTALASANPAAAQLLADIGTAQNDQSAQSTTENAQVTETQTNINTLLALG